MSTAIDFVHAVIPGDPMPGPRPRFSLVPLWKTPELLRRARKASSIDDVRELFRATAYQPTRYKRHLQDVEERLRKARVRYTGERPIVARGQPIEVWILVVFACPTSDHRKQSPARRWWCPKAVGDWDNLAKPVCDAASGVLWHDDSQVVLGHLEKVIGAQGEAPRTEIIARAARRDPETPLFETVRRKTMEAAGDRLPPEVDPCPSRPTSTPTLPLQLGLGPSEEDLEIPF